jgi:chemotaxis protein CheX
MATEDPLIKKYQLAPLPENVLRLGQLIQGAFDTNAHEIAKIIKADQPIADRVIQIATRGRDVDMDIDQAVVRIGVHQITLVVMSELLLHAVRKTFAIMLKLKLEPREVINAYGDQVVGCIHFKGKANGRVYLRIPCKAADSFVTRFLGKDLPAEPVELFPEVVGELLNIIGGNFKSNLVDAGLSCALSVPQVDTKTGFSVDLAGNEHHLSIPFTGDALGMFLDLIISPVATQA